MQTRLQGRYGKFTLYIHPTSGHDSKHASIVNSRRLKIYSIEELENALKRRGINPKTYTDYWERID